MTQIPKNVTMLPRGIRNNNPLNIEYHKRNQWHGQLPYNKLIESRFCRFSHMVWGYRAAAIMLRKYINVYSCNTISRIINKWAPSSENQTVLYIKRVCEFSHVDPDASITFNDQVTMLNIMSAMTVVECGNTFNPQKNSALWDALYKAYVMVRENKTDFNSVQDAT